MIKIQEILNDVEYEIDDPILILVIENPVKYYSEYLDKLIEILFVYIPLYYSKSESELLKTIKKYKTAEEFFHAIYKFMEKIPGLKESIENGKEKSFGLIMRTLILPMEFMLNFYLYFWKWDILKYSQSYHYFCRKLIYVFASHIGLTQSCEVYSPTHKSLYLRPLHTDGILRKFCFVVPTNHGHHPLSNVRKKKPYYWTPEERVNFISHYYLILLDPEHWYSSFLKDLYAPINNKESCERIEKYYRVVLQKTIKRYEMDAELFTILYSYVPEHLESRALKLYDFFTDYQGKPIKVDFELVKKLKKLRRPRKYSVNYSLKPVDDPYFSKSLQPHPNIDQKAYNYLMTKPGLAASQLKFTREEFEFQKYLAKNKKLLFSINK